MSNPRPLIRRRLAAFESHRQTLLEILANSRKRRAQESVFDAESCWKDLMRGAEFYFWEQRMRENTPPNDLRVKNLAALERQLSAARTLLNQNDVAFDLMRAIFQARDNDGSQTTRGDISLASSQILKELNVAAVHLRKLEIAASKAAANAKRKGGRPKNSSAISSDYIIGLARCYRLATNKVPGAGEGPFASFVGAFLDAVGRSIAPSSVIGLIRQARKEAPLLHRGGGLKSPFER
jgi:hypothetical protein